MINDCLVIFDHLQVAVLVTNNNSVVSFCYNKVAINDIQSQMIKQVLNQFVVRNNWLPEDWR